MSNITLAIDDQIITLGREYAQKRNISFNIFVKQLIEQTVKPSSKDWLNDFFALADKANGSSDGKKWTREELYRG